MPLMIQQPAAAPATPAPVIDLRSYGGEYRSHRHDHHQFVLPLHGRLELDTPVGARCVDSVTGILIPAGETHGFAARGGNRFVVVDVPAASDGRIFDRALREPSLPLPCGLHHHLALLAERAAGPPLSAAFRRQWTALLIGALAAPATARHTGESRVARATAWIDGNLQRPLSVSGVAASVGLSPARLRALFQDELGCSPRAWIAAARLTRGAHLLACTDRPVADIALACGFGDQSAFTRAFVRGHGTSPARWRRLRNTLGGTARPLV